MIISIKTDKEHEFGEPEKCAQSPWRQSWALQQGPEIGGSSPRILLRDLHRRCENHFRTISLRQHTPPQVVLTHNVWREQQLFSKANEVTWCRWQASKSNEELAHVWLFRGGTRNNLVVSLHPGFLLLQYLLLRVHCASATLQTDKKRISCN